MINIKIKEYGEEDIFLQDGAYKIFINTKGEIGNVSEDFKELMAYFNHSETVKNSKNPLVHSIEAAVREARNNEKWRHDYMTWQMYGNEKYDEGMEKGMNQKALEIAKNMLAMGLSAEQVAKATQLPLDIIKNQNNS